MASIEPGGLKPGSDNRVAPHERHGKSEKIREREKDGYARPDSVSVRDPLKAIAGELRAQVAGLVGAGAGTGTEGDGGAERFILEVAVRAEVTAAFSTYGGQEAYEPKSADYYSVRVVSAYQSEQSAGQASAREDFWKAQAEQLLNAHAAAFGGADFSPEATADRIVNFALSFFPMYASDNPDMSHEELVDSYRNMVEGAIDEGFSEALRILGELPSNVSEGIDKTRSLVDGKLDDFFGYLVSDGAEAGKASLAEGRWAEFVNGFFNRNEG